MCIIDGFDKNFNAELENYLFLQSFDGISI